MKLRRTFLTRQPEADAFETPDETAADRNLRQLLSAAYPPEPAPDALRRRLTAEHAASALPRPQTTRFPWRRPAFAILTTGAVAAAVAVGLSVRNQQHAAPGAAVARRMPAENPARPAQVVPQAAPNEVAAGVRHTPERVAGGPRTTFAGGNRGAQSAKPTRDAPTVTHNIPPQQYTPAAPADDLAYINGDSAAFLSRWAQLPRSEAAEMEAALLRSVRRGDDFVAVPFPQVASGDRSILAAAIAAYRQEAAIVDSRLQRKVTVGVKATAFSDLCQQLRDTTGIEITAGRSVADDKITLFCKDRPLRDVMRQITQVFGFTWLRTGDENEYKYELVQDLKAQLAEEELRNRDRNEALLALDRKMERYRKFLNVSPEQARELAKSASGEDKELLEQLGGAGWGPAQLYFRLSPDELSALREGRQLTWSGTPTPGATPQSGEQPLPGDLAGKILSGMDRHRVRITPDGFTFGPPDSVPDGVLPSTVTEAKPAASLSLERSELGRFTLNGLTRLNLMRGDGMNSAAIGESLATGESASVQEPRNAEANAAEARKPEMQKRTALQPETTRAEGQARDAARATTADVLEAIHRATGRDVIGDYYTRLYAPDAVTLRATPLFDALNRVCDTTRLRWKESDEWLQFRSTSYFNDRLKEVPNRLLTRWAASRRENKQMTPGDLIEVAQLSDAQLDARSMAEGAKILYGLEEWDLAALGLREHWRFLGALPSAARQAALAETGVAFARMPLAQQQQFIALTFGKSNAPQSPQWEDLSGSTLQVAYQPGASDAGPRHNEPVTFTYRYGGPNTGRWKREVGPRSMSVGQDQTDTAGQRIQRQEQSREQRAPAP